MPEQDLTRALLQASSLHRDGGPERSKPAAQVPTVGRDVHYQPMHAERIETGNGGKGQPYPAKITHVHEDGTVNLFIFNDATWQIGKTFKARVPQSQEATPTHGTWQWPPRV